MKINIPNDDNHISNKGYGVMGLIESLSDEGNIDVEIVNDDYRYDKIVYLNNSGIVANNITHPIKWETISNKNKQSASVTGRELNIGDEFRFALFGATIDNNFAKNKSDMVFLQMGIIIPLETYLFKCEMVFDLPIWFKK